MVRSKCDESEYVSEGHRRGPRVTRYNLSRNPPPHLPKVITALLSEQPRLGYPDKNAVMGVLNGCGYKVKGERDDLYRFLLNHGAVLCPDDYGLAIHVCDPEEAELLRAAYADKCDQPAVTAARCRANYLVQLFKLGYQLVAPSGERLTPPPPINVNQEVGVASLDRPQDLYDLLEISDLRDTPDLIRAMNEVELDGIVERIHRLEPEQTAIIELVVKDKARRLDEAEQSRERERKRRELDAAKEAAALELARIEAQAATARLEADKTAADLRRAKQHLAEIERNRARL